MSASLIALAALAPTIAQVLRMPPAEAGELILEGRQHHPIEMVSRDEIDALRPPRQVTLRLVERPVATPHGCVRTRWTANFQAAPGLDENAATIHQIYGTTEIQMPVGGMCPRDGYVHLNPNVMPKQAFDALQRLDGLRGETWKPRLSCRDRTASELCASDAKIREALGALSPWAISQAGDSLVVWLGKPGQVVTEVRFDPSQLDTVSVERRIPAPA